MGFVRWWYLATNYARIELSVATVPSRLVGSFRRCVGIVRAIGLIVLIVRPFVGGRQC